MLAAFGWGALGASALLVGAVIAYQFHPNRRIIAFVMALGTGLLPASDADALRVGRKRPPRHLRTFQVLTAGFLVPRHIPEPYFFRASRACSLMRRSASAIARCASAEGSPSDAPRARGGAGGWRSLGRDSRSGLLELGGGLTLRRPKPGKHFRKICPHVTDSTRLARKICHASAPSSGATGNRFSAMM